MGWMRFSLPVKRNLEQVTREHGSRRNPERVPDTFSKLTEESSMPNGWQNSATSVLTFATKKADSQGSTT